MGRALGDWLQARRTQRIVQDRRGELVSGRGVVGSVTSSAAVVEFIDYQCAYSRMLARDCAERPPIAGAGFTGLRHSSARSWLSTQALEREPPGVEAGTSESSAVRPRLANVRWVLAHRGRRELSCPVSRMPHVVLEEVSDIPLGEIPRSVAALSPRVFPAVFWRPSDSTFALEVVDSVGHRHEVRRFPDPATVSVNGATAVVRRSHSVSFDGLGHEPPQTVVDIAADRPEGLIVAAAAAGSALWYLVVSGEDTTVESVRVVGSERHAPRRWRVGTVGSLVALSEGTVALAEIHPPHHVLLLNAERDDVVVIDVAAQGFVPARDATRSVALVPLGCDFALLTVADLRSARRWLLLLHLREARVIRVATLDAPFGVFQGDSSARLLYGFTDENGRRGIKIWRWSWAP